jgi:molybdopterin-biosynthesis enzyme MoeA-like protein
MTRSAYFQHCLDNKNLMAWLPIRPQSLQLRQVFTRTLESDMAEVLARAQSLHPGVEIGSYPKFLENRSVMVMLTVEGDDGAMVTKCVDSIRSQVECFDTAEECLGVDK